jgi:hypothetical protein
MSSSVRNACASAADTGCHQIQPCGALPLPASSMAARRKAKAHLYQWGSKPGAGTASNPPPPQTSKTSDLPVGWLQTGFCNAAQSPRSWTLCMCCTSRPDAQAQPASEHTAIPTVMLPPRKLPRLEVSPADPCSCLHLHLGTLQGGLCNWCARIASLAAPCTAPLLAHSMLMARQLSS